MSRHVVLQSMDGAPVGVRGSVLAAPDKVGGRGGVHFSQVWGREWDGACIGGSRSELWVPDNIEGGVGTYYFNAKVIINL